MNEYGLNSENQWVWGKKLSGVDWLPSLIYREETGHHRHCGPGYMACIRNTSGFSPKVFRMLWLDRRALVS